MTVQHKSLRDEILFVIGRSSLPLNSGEIYERCELAEEIKSVSDALWVMRCEGKIAFAEGEGRKRYVLADGVSAPAPAGKEGRPQELPVAPAPIKAKPADHFAGDGKMVQVNDVDADARRLADAMLAKSRQQLAPGLEGGPQWWIDQDGCLEISDRGDNGLLVEFSREQARLMAEMILAAHIVLDSL